MLDNFLGRNKSSTTCDKAYFVVRSKSAGVFYGEIEDMCEETQRVTMKNARRVWYWAGAASLSQLSIDGVTQPEECKFPEKVANVILFEVIEILPLTPKAKRSLDSVEPWKA